MWGGRRMTREEAINMIKALIGTYITCHGEEDTIAVPLDNIDIEAFDMAIKALEQEPRWIPMVRREPTDEEKAEYLAQNGEELGYMLENEMPLNGQEVLVSIGELVSEDVFYEEFYNFESNDIDSVDAWMPLPKPYSEVIKNESQTVD